MLRLGRLPGTSSAAAPPLEALLLGGDPGNARADTVLHRLQAAWVGLANAAARILAEPLDRLSPSRRWMLRDTGTGFEVLCARGRRIELVGRIEDGAAPAETAWLRDLRRSDRIELRLDPERIVRQRIPLPADSAAFASAMIEHRLDRLTPWRAEDVVYGYALAPGEQHGTVEIDFAATSRDIALGALRRLDRLAIRPGALGSAAEPAEAPVAVDLLARTGQTRATRRQRWLRRLCLAGLPVALAAFLASLAVMGQAQARLDEATSVLNRQRAAVQARGTGPGDETLAALMAEKTTDRAAFALIDRLAAALPDDAVLSDLELTPTELHIRGRSGNAPALVSILEGQANLRDVRFQSTVVREATGGDRFDIVAQRPATTAVEAAP